MLVSSSLGLRFGGKFVFLSLEIRLLGIRLRADRDVLAGRHGQRASHKTRYAGDQDVLAGRLRRSHADDKTRG